MAGGHVWDVFLAYPQPDRQRARELFEALTAEGLRVCFDQEVLRAGDDWHALLAPSPPFGGRPRLLCAVGVDKGHRHGASRRASPRAGSSRHGRDDVALRGRAYQQAGDLDQAIPLLETNREESERVLDPNHPMTLVSRDRLALPTRQRESSIAPSRCSKPTWLIGNGSKALIIPQTLTSRNNLALAYQAAGDGSRALLFLEAVLADRERVLGPEHPEMLQNRQDVDRARAGHGARQVHAQPTSERDRS